MNRDDIIRMAQECHLIGMRPHLDGIYQESLERFFQMAYAAGVSAEREACEKICVDHGHMGLAAAIRARGQV